MRDVDVPALASKLRAHFSKCTNGDFDLCWQDCKEFELATVASAIEAYHRELGDRAWRPDPKKLRGHCVRLGQATVPTQSGERVIEWLRRTTRIGDLDPQTALVSHFSRCWAETADAQFSDDIEESWREYGKQFIRQLIRVHARQSFLELRMGIDTADELSRMVVDLQEGEQIRLRPMLRPVEV